MAKKGLLDFAVTASRKMNDKQVLTYLTTDGISVAMNLADFKDQMIEELGSITFVLKNKTFKKKVDKVFENILKSMKEELVKNPHLVPMGTRRNE